MKAYKIIIIFIALSLLNVRSEIHNKMKLDGYERLFNKEVEVSCVWQKKQEVWMVCIGIPTKYIPDYNLNKGINYCITQTIKNKKGRVAFDAGLKTWDVNDSLAADITMNAEILKTSKLLFTVEFNNADLLLSLVFHIDDKNPQKVVTKLNIESLRVDGVLIGE